jgi:hypothetical protein
VKIGGRRRRDNLVNDKAGLISLRLYGKRVKILNVVLAHYHWFAYAADLVGNFGLAVTPVTNIEETYL